MLVRALQRFFGTGPDRPLISHDPEVIRPTYERWRWSVFLSVTFGYGFFYVSRINFSVLKEPLLKAGLLDPGQMGLIGSALLVVYAAGRLTNGFLADRANIGRFMSTALLLSATVNLGLGVTAWGFYAFLLAWALNGWFQSVGSAPSVVALSHWFGNKERGTRYGLWSASHSIGEAITFVGTSSLVAAVGWRAGFVAPGLICALVALVMYRTLADRPQTLGLPPIWEYRGEEAPSPAAERSVGKSQLEVIRHPAVWALSLASASMYVARYGMASWGTLFLQKNKGYSLQAAGSVLGVYPLAEIAGSATSGLISDRWFGSRRHPVALMVGLLQVASMIALYIVPPGHRLLDALALVGFGFGLGGLLAFLGGLMAVDLVPRRAAGAAMGIVGVFSYAGAAVQDTVSGYLIKATKRAAAQAGGSPSYDLGPAFRFWVGAAALSVLLTLLTWRSKPRTVADE